MIKNMQFRLLFIPILGILIPLVSGIVDYSNYSRLQIIGANSYFILTSFIIWRGCHWIHLKARPLFRKYQNPFIKIISISLISSVYGMAIGDGLAMTWFYVSKETYSTEKLSGFIFFTVIIVITLTLVYEILFLSKERELDSRIVDELDRERIRAEISILQNELDPHFIFNSLNTLNHLIITSPNMAHLYNTRLAQVYLYFLANKNRELVSLQNEMEFIENYFFLLQIRHENKLQLETNANGLVEGKIMIPPCALQTLVENAIKHNEFSDSSPLTVKIYLNGKYLNVSNSIRPKPYLASSTKIGLRNLRSRYKLVSNKDIIIETDENNFLVRLPLISNT